MGPLVLGLGEGMGTRLVESTRTALSRTSHTTRPWSAGHSLSRAVTTVAGCDCGRLAWDDRRTYLPRPERAHHLDCLAMALGHVVSPVIPFTPSYEYHEIVYKILDDPCDLQALLLPDSLLTSPRRCHAFPRGGAGIAGL